MTDRTHGGFRQVMARLRRAAQNRSPIEGLTHCFYRYPARFSPTFAGAAIDALSSPGEVIVDPYMGGGTAVVEALVRGRMAIGNDLNTLGVFVTRVKTTPLDNAEREALLQWAGDIVPALGYRAKIMEPSRVVCPRRTRNLSLPIARPIKKIIALALEELSMLPNERCRNFVRCALLNVGQLALNGRKRTTPLWEFRELLHRVIRDMLIGVKALQQRLAELPSVMHPPRLLNVNAADLATQAPFAEGVKADLVVTSPPYPGIHILYHRWQVDGRRETPAPYWIAGCNDGQGAAFYNFSDRRETAADGYFAESLATLRALRQVVKKGAFVVQLVAFNSPRSHLRRYLKNMEHAGFEEFRLHMDARPESFKRIWRTVPRRRWHANLKGNLNSSREVVLVHKAV